VDLDDETQAAQRNIVSQNTLVSMIDYLHQNPVRRGLVTRPSEWHLSSAGCYECEEVPPPLIPDRIPPEWTEGTRAGEC
jgi:putative transposase